METKSTASLPRNARAWIAIGFAAVAIAAVVSNAQAFTGSAAQSDAGSLIALPAQLAEPADQVDWSTLPLSTITPAESVAAYDR